jgi:predicted esterase
MSDLGFIHQFIPAQDNQSDRVLLLLHGTGGNENDMVPIGRDLDTSAALLSLRGNILENGMPRFFRRLAEGVFDEADVIRRANELANFLPKAAKQYEFDLKRLTAVGYSNGANIAASMLLLRPEILSAAILFRAMVPLTPETRPNLNSKHIWIGAGAHDPIIPASNTQELVEMLRSFGAEVTIRFFQSGHELTSDDVDLAREYLTHLRY